VVSQEAERPEFKISDRRRFTPEGQPLDEAPETLAAADPIPEHPKEGRGVGSAPQSHADAERSFLPQARFETLILSLAMQAQLELSPDPDSSEPPNLELARHTIDLLGVLLEKTRGNLTLEESRLLENTVTELRFRYVHKIEEINTQAGQAS
jgi:hypothetical protein